MIKKKSNSGYALGVEELLERHPHELAVHKEVEWPRLVVRLRCEKAEAQRVRAPGWASN
jgi:hypothetical protein